MPTVAAAERQDQPPARRAVQRAGLDLLHAHRPDVRGRPVAGAPDGADDGHVCDHGPGGPAGRRRLLGLAALPDEEVAGEVQARPLGCPRRTGRSQRRGAKGGHRSQRSFAPAPRPAAIVCFVRCFIAAAALTAAPLSALPSRCSNREHNAAGGFKLKEVLKFEDAGHVELLARCVRVWTFESALDPDAIKLSESIIKARRTHFVWVATSPAAAASAALCVKSLCVNRARASCYPPHRGSG